MPYTDADRTNDFQWFKQNYDSLFSKYGHKVFAIKSGAILGTFDSKDAAIDSISKTHKPGSFIVQECNGNESGYTNYIASWELV